VDDRPQGAARQRKKFSRLRDQLNQQRWNLPWVKVDKEYVFDGSDGNVTLAELFDGKGQLIVYHFMFGPGWKEGCPHCSFWADHYDKRRPSPRAERYNAGRHFPRPIEGNRTLQKTDGLEVQVGFLVQK